MQTRKATKNEEAEVEACMEMVRELLTLNNIPPTIALNALINIVFTVLALETDDLDSVKDMLEACLNVYWKAKMSGDLTKIEPK